MIALIDSDILCYRVGAVTEEENENTAIETMAVYLEDMLMFDLLDCEEHELFLTGKQNFRYDVAVTAPYKGNRKDVKKPKHLPLLREYLQTAWGASVSDGQEADDDIAIRATELKGGKDSSYQLTKTLCRFRDGITTFVKKEKKDVTPEDGLALLLQTDPDGGRSRQHQGNAPCRGRELRQKMLARVPRRSKSSMRVVWRRWAQSVCWRTAGCCGYAGQPRRNVGATK